MADKTINQLTEDTSPTSDDYIPSWDVGTGTSKKITLLDVLALLGSAASAAAVATSETTTSGTAADLTTPGPSVTATIRDSGVALVIVQASASNSVTATASGILYCIISGATTVAATGITSQRHSTLSQAVTLNGIYLFTGLNAGSNTFKMQYSVTAGTEAFSSRRISVIPL